MSNWIDKLNDYRFQVPNIINGWILKIATKRHIAIQRQRRVHYWVKKEKRDIKSFPSGPRLENIQKQEIRNYYSPFVKCKTLFHEFYFACTGKHDVRYIPDDVYYTRLDPFYNNWDEVHFYDNKAYYGTIFSDVEQPTTVAIRCGDLWLDRYNELITYNDAISASLALRGVFVKQATDSEGGHGVYYVMGRTELEQIIKRIDGDLVIQEPLKQHPEMNKLNATSVNTIRVLSLLSNEGVKIYSTVVRMGINGARVDNASSGGITCGVKENGQLKDVAFSSSGERYVKHPSSNISFTEVTIPNYAQVHSMVKKLHKRLPHFKLVSWDIAIREDATPVLIEVNIHYGELDFHQLNNGPVFGDDTEKILKEVFEERQH